MSRHSTAITLGSLLLGAVNALNSEYFSILEKSLTEDESAMCDLVFFEQSLGFGDWHNFQRAITFVSNLSYNKWNHSYTSCLPTHSLSDVIKELTIFSQCLVLVMNEKVTLKEMRYLAGQVQCIRPVGVIFHDEKTSWKDFTGMRWPFPTILKSRGKYKHTNT